MSIAIEPISAERLHASGDIATELVIPFDPADDRFHLAFSDGALIAGEYDPEEDTSLYLVETEGVAGDLGLEESNAHACRLAWANGPRKRLSHSDRRQLPGSSGSLDGR